MSSELTQRLTTMMARVSAGCRRCRCSWTPCTSAPVPSRCSDDFDLVALPYYLNSRAASIYAGTNEVQRDLIARTVAAR